ncbi:hypothetical protein M5689_002360 [Euphorbia peplus]|nr:hypothetical protein M5689_002360 [Euphorbia peplus]
MLIWSSNNPIIRVKDGEMEDTGEEEEIGDNFVFYPIADMAAFDWSIMPYVINGVKGLFESIETVRGVCGSVTEIVTKNEKPLFHLNEVLNGPIPPYLA